VEGQESSVSGGLLLLWLTLMLLLQGAIWTTGVPDYRLVQAVEQGAAEVERRQADEENEDVVRKAIELQRRTLPFWSVVVALRDFLIAPLMLGLRPLSVAVALSALAAATGRPVGFAPTLSACIAWQGLWVLGVAVRFGLMVLLQRSYVSTSILLFLPQETYTAVRWAFIEQLDCFAFVGWCGMAWGAWQRRQANLVSAILVVGLMALLDAAIRAGGGLLLNLSMRMTLIPQ